MQMARVRAGLTIVEARLAVAGVPTRRDIEGVTLGTPYRQAPALFGH